MMDRHRKIEVPMGKMKVNHDMEFGPKLWDRPSHVVTLGFRYLKLGCHIEFQTKWVSPGSVSKPIYN